MKLRITCVVAGFLSLGLLVAAQTATNNPPASSVSAPNVDPALSGGGTASYLPLWETTTQLGSSLLFQSTAGKIGVGTTSPNSLLDVNGALNAQSFKLAGRPFASGSFANSIVFLGFAGSSASSGPFNTAIGAHALGLNSTGQQNTATGANALPNNTLGSSNTAIGTLALQANSIGGNNTAVGAAALSANTSGSFNTALGANAGQSLSGSQINGGGNTFIGYAAGPLTNSPLTFATAIGANATVSESFAMTLGGTGPNAINVGIGTSSPFFDYALDVEATTFAQINGGVVVNAGGGNIYLGMTNGVHKFRVDTNGVAYADGGYQSSGADFAESMAVRGQPSEYEPGDVLEIDPQANRHLTLSRHPYATLVAGIYSTKPGLLATPRGIDDSAVHSSEIPLAVVGIVPCKVTTENGQIARGDLLVTSSRPGYAMKGTNRRRMLGAVVGKALEPLANGAGVIQVLVTLQ